MTAIKNRAPKDPQIRLACVEICKFRRLAQTRLHIDESTTIIVGANNSGKTSLLTAIRKFIGDSPSFRSFDISLSQWQTLRKMCLAWEALAENPASESGAADDWKAQLQEFLECMPTVDLWFDAKEGAYNYVAPFLTSFKWSGGAVGVRLRLEPASSIDELQQLAWRYREARHQVKDLDKSAHAWPIDILDYWLRHAGDLRTVSAYKLDPAKGPLSTKPPHGVQALAAEASPVEMTHLNRLIRIDFVSAQRGLGGEDDDMRGDTDAHRVGLFSNQLLKYARQHLNVETTGRGHRADLIQAVAKAQTELDKTIRDALEPSVQDVRTLGYPGLYDPQEIHFRTRIQTADLLDHSTAVQYRLDKDSPDESLPEFSIGLGYQNLQSLSYQLVSFKASRLNPKKGGPAAVHLVMVEEPEAHLHVQVQRIFPAKAHKLISPSNPEHRSLRSQLLISTHSSHLAHAESFARLRYVRRISKKAPWGMPSTEIINLGDAFGDDVKTRTFAERYFRVQHTDLLFADAAIFVEGTAERMLVPLFIEKSFPDLSNRYVSILDIGGSHAHRLRPLVERLGIPTVVITDIDPVQPKKDAKGRITKPAVHIAGQNDLECGNDTLTAWHPKPSSFAALRTPTIDQLILEEPSGMKVRFAWQVPVKAAGGQWPSSFEDSLVLENRDRFKALSTAKADEVEIGKGPPKGALAAVVARTTDHPDFGVLAQELHKLLHGSFNKGNFAADLFERMTAGLYLDCPAYIAEALAWLQDQIKPAAKEIP